MNLFEPPSSFNDEAIEATIVEPKRVRPFWLLVFLFSAISLAATIGIVSKWRQYQNGAARLQGKWKMDVSPIVSHAVDQHSKTQDSPSKMADGVSKMILGATSGGSMDFRPDGKCVIRFRALLFFGDTRKGTWRVSRASGDDITVIVTEEDTAERFRLDVHFQDDDHALLNTSGELGDIETIEIRRIVDETSTVDSELDAE